MIGGLQDMGSEVGLREINLSRAIHRFRVRPGNLGTEIRVYSTFDVGLRQV
jgi:hypothetical protein